MIVEHDNLYVKFDPLNMVVSIQVKSGNIKQVHYSESNTYTPNRKITPLYLQPSVYITDPNKIIANGEKVNQLSSGRWYLGSVTAANEITTKTTDAGGNTADYAIGTNYQLVIRKNTEYLSPQMLYFVGTFFDSRRGMDVHAQNSVLLSSTSNTESEAAPTLVLDAPLSNPFNPIEGLGNKTFTASLFRTGAKVPDTNVKYWWYVVESGVEHLIGSKQLDLAYVSGQNTNKLTVNTEYIGKLLIRCKAMYYTGTAPTAPDKKAAIAETKLIRKLPASTYWQINKITGSVVLPGDTTIRREAEAYTNKGKISNPGKYWHFRWFHNTNKAGAKDIEVGHGTSLSLPVSYAGGMSSTPGTIKLDVQEFTEYQALMVGNDVLTDKNGEVLTGFTTK